MSEKELDRVEVMGRVKGRDLKLRDAAVLLGGSYRQAKRIQRRYREGGAGGLKHGNAGQRSPRARPLALLPQILQLLRDHSGGITAPHFGPTLSAHHLV